MLAYTPELRGERPALVVALHGCGQTAEGFAVGSGWAELARRHGFALLAPEQQRQNNPNVCFSWFEPRHVARDAGEALSIRQMIAHMVSVHDLDEGRVFITGLSAGGAMANVMLATYPEVFAGGGIVAGLPFGSAGSLQEALEAMRGGRSRSVEEWAGIVRAASGHHSGPWPRVSIWHGGADTVVAAANGDEIIKQWTGVHGLPRHPTAEESVAGHTRGIWMNGNGEVQIEAFLIPGLGHGAPLAARQPGRDEGCGEPGPFLLEAGISSSLAMARFWGLPVSGAGHAAAGEAGEAPRVDPWQAAALAQAGATDPGAVIAAALQSAGLLAPGTKVANDSASIIAAALRAAGIGKRQ
jgi:poly(hydroxyalkanoate) depolymerase family esterase